MSIIAEENKATKITARWAVNVTDWRPTHEQYTLALNSIQTEERERILRFRLEQDQKSSLIGRLLLRWLFHTVYRVDWEAIRFGRSANNKPILISPEVNYTHNSGLLSDPKIDFNISHHGDWVVLVSIENFIENRKQNLNVIGVDVMKIEVPNEPISQFFEIFRDQFSEYEYNTIKPPNLSEKEQLQRFYRYWCLKESYVKAIGVGLNMKLSDIEFRLADDELVDDGEDIKSIKTKTQLYVINEPCPEWKFEESYLDQSHCVAIAYYYKQKKIHKSGDDAVTARNTVVGDDDDETLPFKVLDVNDILQYAKEIS
ncbi:11744_t:CDS:2 [Ambispora gerdemannii]|uniref:holo-[acyl-carrier-protein] synthase n=1 Tax=Ambispora gerdemannii TaxID=144530 RepID=A0A9N8V305_9GLOM|nr:11744_t:CDS:2 [Ambispora gerdemannii]